jgi:hypothetical protein
MSYGKKQAEFNLDLEAKLNELHLTPSERANAIGAMRVAEDAVEIVRVLRAAMKRIAGFMSLKPSVRT